MIQQRQMYEIVCKGGTLEITQTMYKDLMAGKIFRNPNWAPECFIQYNKDTDLWYTDKLLDGATADKSGVYDEIKFLVTQKNYVKALSPSDTILWKKACGLARQANTLIEEARSIMKSLSAKSRT